MTTADRKIRRWNPATGDHMADPLRWRKPTVVEVVPDVFGDLPYDGFLEDFFAVVMSCHVFENFDHVFLLRADDVARMRAYFDSRSPAEHLRVWAEAGGGGWIACDNEDVCFHEIVEGRTMGRWDEVAALVPGTLAAPYTHIETLWPLPNLWLGVRCSDQPSLDTALPLLFACPAAHYWLDLRGLNGPVDLRAALDRPELACPDGLAGCEVLHLGPSPLSWVCVSGGLQPLHPDWVRSIRDQCRESGVPFHFAGWGAWRCVARPTDADEIVSAALGYPRGRWLGPNGEDTHRGWETVMVNRVRDRRTERLLDGVEHLAMPGLDPAEAKGGDRP